MLRIVTALLFTLLVSLASGCATEKMRSKETVLDETLRSYAATVRWGDMEQAMAFLDPGRRAEKPPTALELARYRQVRVSGYEELGVQPVGEDEVRQSVRIELVNVNTQRARSIVDHQVWKYDEAARRWWLTSGLPDISHPQ
ncbi:hypothetical protein [Dokdonella sp.]|uniref:hypothetical protein n=1 Tax=Dokdonella sp. TaxID=2291710 RepID=UPI0031C93CDC|nr:hypothetical protein [Dokdonella sp.]